MDDELNNYAIVLMNMLFHYSRQVDQTRIKVQPHTDHTLAERTSCGVTTRAYGEPWVPSASRYPSSAPRTSSAAPSAALPAKASSKASVARASSSGSAVVAAATSSELRRLPATLLCTAGLHYLTAQDMGWT